MQSADLSWLRYVCYGVWAIAAALFFSARTDVSGLRKPFKIAVACVLVFAAMTVWTLQERHSQVYSPRQTVTGVVAWLSEGTIKGGSFYDDFGLFLLPNWAVSQSFTTDILGHSGDARPIARGDTLKLEYRVWDDKILSMDELSGTHPGWQHRYSPEGLWMVYVGAAIAIGGLIWFITAWRAQKEGRELTYEDDVPDPPSDIQTLGLGSGDR